MRKTLELSVLVFWMSLGLGACASKAAPAQPTTRPATPGLTDQQQREISQEIATTFAQAVKDHARAEGELASLKPEKHVAMETLKDFKPWGLSLSGPATNYSEAMESLVQKCLLGPAMADDRVAAYVRAAGTYLTHKDARYRAAACEFLTWFPRQAVEAGLTPTIGGLLDDQAAAFKGLNLANDQRREFTSLAGDNGDITVGGVAAMALDRMTTFRFSDEVAFKAWWSHNADYRSRLWYWSLRWRKIRADSGTDDQAAASDVAALEPAEALRLMLLVDNSYAVVADAGLTEESGNTTSEPAAVKQVAPYPVEFTAKTMAGFVKAHSYKGRLLRMVEQEIPWPEAMSDRATEQLWYTIFRILPLVLDPSDAAVIETVLADPRGLMALPGNGDKRAELSRIAIALDPDKAEGILTEHLERDPHQPDLAAQLVAATGLKHWDLIQAACPNRSDKAPVIKALASLRAPQAASALAQWFNAENWTPKIDENGYEGDAEPMFFLEDFAQAAAVLNGGKPVVEKELLARARWVTRKGMTQEEIRQANKPVPVARAEIVAQLKQFFPTATTQRATHQPAPAPATQAITRPASGLVEQPNLIRTLAGHSAEVQSVAFSADGKTLASGSADKTIKLWDVSTGKNTATLEGHDAAVRTVAFSPDGKTLASGSEDKTIRLWDTATGKTTATLEGHTDEVWAVAFSADGKTLATGSLDQTIKLWDVATHKSTGISEGHPDGVISVAFSPDAKTLAVGIRSGTIKLWDLTTGKGSTISDTDEQYFRPFVAFSPDGKTLARAGLCSEVISLWDLATGKNTANLKAHDIYGVAASAYTPDSRILISVGVHDHEMKFWDVASGNNIGSFNKQEDFKHRYACGALSPDGKNLAVGTSENKIELWELKIAVPATQPAALPGSQIKDLAALQVFPRLTAAEVEAVDSPRPEELDAKSDIRLVSAQSFKVIKELGKHGLPDSIELTYTFSKSSESPVAKGQRVLWILGDGNGKGLYPGGKAFVDNDENRRTVGDFVATAKFIERQTVTDLPRMPGSDIALANASAHALFTGICTAVDDGFGISWAIGVVEVTQKFRIEEYLWGSDQAKEIEIRYTQYMYQQERMPKKGERLIWLVRPSEWPGRWEGLKALADTDTNRTLVRSISRINATQPADAFRMLVRQAVALKPETINRTGGSSPTGLDFGPILADTGQDEILKDFPDDSSQQETAIKAVAKSGKLWALASLLNHDSVGVRISAARALVELAPPQAIPALLAAAKANAYPGKGSESGTLHFIYRSELKAGLEKITGLTLTPKGLHVTEDPQPGQPPMIRSVAGFVLFAEEVDFPKVEVWLAERYLSPPATLPATPNQ